MSALENGAERLFANQPPDKIARLTSHKGRVAMWDGGTVGWSGRCKFQECSLQLTLRPSRLSSRLSSSLAEGSYARQSGRDLLCLGGRPRPRIAWHHAVTSLADHEFRSVCINITTTKSAGFQILDSLVMVSRCEELGSRIGLTWTILRLFTDARAQ